MENVPKQEDLVRFQKLKKQCDWKIVRDGKCGAKGGWKVAHGSELDLRINVEKCFTLCEFIDQKIG